MRDLKKSDRNSIEFNDPLSGTPLIVYYATPTASQIRAYQQMSIQRKGNKVVMNSFDPAMKYGQEIITGIGEGCFGYDGRAISSDPESPDYRQDWKELMAESAADVVTLLARHVFDGLRASKDTLEIEGAMEDAVPFDGK